MVPYFVCLFVLLGQEIVTLFGKPADQVDGVLVSRRTIFLELEFKLLLYQKGCVCMVVATNFLVPESIDLAAK